MKPEAKKNIDALFREKLKDYENNIDSDFNYVVLKHIMQKNKKNKTLMLLLKWSFSLMLFIGMLWLLLWKWQQFNHNNTTSSNQNARLSTLTRNNNVVTPSSDQLNTHFSPSSEHSPAFNQLKDKTNLFNPKMTSSSLTLSQSHQPLSKDTFLQNNIEPPSHYINSSASNTYTIDNHYPDAFTQYLSSAVETFYIPFGDDSVKVMVHPCIKEINSPYPDYAPVINADGTEMYFTSRRPTLIKNKKRNDVKEVKENIYYSRFNKDTQKWSEAQILPHPINIPDRFNSAVALSNDGQHLFIYRDDNNGNGDIYECVLKGREWSEPQRLPEPINSKYHESSISLSPDGNTIYFTSNRLGGKGGMDIWYAVKDKNGKWSKAVNMGSIINTDKDEEGVFIHPDGKTLYFSSRGHKGFGGYDIFYSKFENGKWTTPINLGKNINTKDDDVYFVVEANGINAYYATVRKDGVGEKDIYKLSFVFPEEKKKNIAQLTLFKGNVLDKTNQQPLDADIELIDLDKNEKITTLTSNASTGAFMLSLPAGKNYAINVRKQGYLFYSENFNIPSGDEYKEVHKTIMLDKLIVGAKVILKNIFYDYDKATLRPESKTELDKLYELMIQNPHLKVELSAHTDSRGSDTYNLKLSQERAQSCVDYLISKGIPKDRILAKGYGEQQPLIKDEEINKMASESEKESAHQQNRRTEIKIIEN